MPARKSRPVRRLRPLTIPQLRLAAEQGELTPEDILACSWIRRARTPRLPHGKAAEIVFELAERVRAYREDHHMSVQDFAELAGTSGSFVSQFECGLKQSVTLSTLLMFAEACGAELRIDFVNKPGARRVASS